MSIIRSRSIVLVLILVAVITSACQPPSNGPKIVVSDSWSRTALEMGAVYVTIENQGNESDRLIGASTTAAQTVEIHETFMDGDVMSMRPVEGGLEIPAGETVKLKPGGQHIMLIGLVEPLLIDHNIKVTLQFEKSGEVVLDVEIRAQ